MGGGQEADFSFLISLGFKNLATNIAKYIKICLVHSNVKSHSITIIISQSGTL